jgi:hypothetical protein
MTDAWTEYWDPPVVPGWPMTLHAGEKPARPRQVEIVPWEVCLGAGADHLGVSGRAEADVRRVADELRAISAAHSASSPNDP